MCSSFLTVGKETCMKDEGKINQAKVKRAREVLNMIARKEVENMENSREPRVYYTNVDIGERLRDIRKDNNFTQAELAELLGLTRSAVNSWEMSDSLPSTLYLMKLAKLYKVSIDYLVGLDNREFVDISDLSSADKEIIYGLLKRFKKK